MKYLLILFTAGLIGCQSSPAWKAEFDDRLPVLGHRNFIVIADSAYPAQSRPGITTVATGEDHAAVIAEVLAAVREAPHVNPVVYLDAELTRVPERDAPGIEPLRARIEEILKNENVRRLPHMDIIERLDESAKLFEVLILKTRGTLPYTSVFLELDCGYWDADAERRLRG